jgi:hypothetical protein
MSDQVLIAWSGDTIVVAFRGTASLRNVLHDLQARSQVLSPLPSNWEPMSA